MTPEEYIDKRANAVKRIERADKELTKFQEMNCDLHAALIGQRKPHGNVVEARLPIKQNHPLWIMLSTYFKQELFDANRSLQLLDEENFLGSQSECEAD